MTLSDLGVTLVFETFLTPIRQWVLHILSMLFVYMSGKVSVVFNRNCFQKMKDFSRLAPPPTGSHIHRKSGSIKEMVQDRHVVTEHH